jgi:hypothetical protein
MDCKVIGCEHNENIEMSDNREYRLKIDVFSVDSLPMGRLAEYMAELAKLLGEREHVHFSHLESGSAVLVSIVDEPAIPKVAERVQQVRERLAPKEAMQAFCNLDFLLAKDNAVAVLIPSDSSQGIDFPGRTRPKPMRYGPFREHGMLDGVLIRIGGRDETIPVWLKDGEVEYHCQVREEVARRMAPHYLDGTLRVYGSGKWMREDNGTWILQQFDIEDFELLDDSSLADVVGKLRAVEGSTWHKSEDAVRDAIRLRSDEGDHH